MPTSGKKPLTLRPKTPSWDGRSAFRHTVSPPAWPVHLLAYLPWSPLAKLQAAQQQGSSSASGSKYEHGLNELEEGTLQAGDADYNRTRRTLVNRVSKSGPVRFCSLSQKATGSDRIFLNPILSATGPKPLATGCVWSRICGQLQPVHYVTGCRLSEDHHQPVKTIRIRHSKGQLCMYYTRLRVFLMHGTFQLCSPRPTWSYLQFLTYL